MKLFIIFVVILLSGVTMSCIGICMEKKAFNNAKCVKCGNNLRLFDTDSHGGRGYTCDDCKHKVWVSYHSVDREYRRSLDQLFKYLED